MTNVVGPFLVTKALLPLIRKGAKKQVEKCNFTSDLLSISQPAVDRPWTQSLYIPLFLTDRKKSKMRTRV